MKRKNRSFSRYLLTRPALVSKDTRWKEIDAYRRAHKGIGFDEVFNLRKALAVFLLPSLRLRVKEMKNVSEKTFEKDGTARDAMPRCTDEAIGALYKILNDMALEPYEVRSLLEVIGVLLRE